MAITTDERARLAALQRLNLLDTPAEERFDRFTRIARHVFAVPVALISLVDADRQWFKSRQGMELCETPRDISFCTHAIHQGGLMVVPDATLDPRFSSNPFVTRDPFVRFYAGRVLEDEHGNRLGTLCILDTRPRSLDDIGQRILGDLADCVERELGVVQSLHHAHAILTEREAHLRAVLDNAASVILTLDENRRIDSINDMVRTIFGYATNEVLGQPIAMLLPDVREYPSDAARAVLRPGTHEARGVRRNGTTLPLEIVVSRMADEGGDRLVVIVRDITERVRAAEIERRQAYYDLLTSLPNRAFLCERFSETLSATPAPRCALIALGLDRLRDINNTLGHPIGDLLLTQIGPRIQPVLGDADLLAYLGGGAFGLLLPGADRERALDMVRKLREALAPSFTLEFAIIDAEASVGIALAPDHGDEPYRLMQYAEVALQAARQTDDKCVVYAPERDPYTPRRLALMNALNRALERDQISLVYQPKVDLKTGRTVGVEALARWQHPDLGAVGPDEFIPVAEQSGFIKPLTRWVLRTALRQCAAWHEAGLPISVAVNISVRNLQDQGLVEQVARELKDAHVPAKWLELEITESGLMADPARAMRVLTRLRRMGIHLSIDDFGTGYSSLSYLKKLPVSSVKIDKSFVMDMVADDDDAAIVRSTVDMAHHLGLRVIAEGMETRETWGRLEAFGCDEGQGYYLSRPVSGDILGEWLRSSPWGYGSATPAAPRLASLGNGRLRRPANARPKQPAAGASRARSRPKPTGSSGVTRSARLPKATRS